MENKSIIVTELKKVLREVNEERYFTKKIKDDEVINESINKSIITDDLSNYNKLLISAIVDNTILKKHFVFDINNSLIIKIEKINLVLETESHFMDSLTNYRNKIGLSTKNNLIQESSDIVLDFPYKDSVLKAGMSKDDYDKKFNIKENFYHEYIDSEEIDRLFDKKILSNVKLINIYGEKEVSSYENSNLIIKGNNLIALHSIRENFKGKVNLIYIDPPFNTGSDSFMYNDKFTHSSWLTFMKNRLEIAKELLSDNGSIVIHLDWNESHYLKVLADEIFGRENFLNEIIWHYEKWTSSSKNLQKNHDNLIVYSKNKGNHKFNIVKRMTENLKEKYEKGYLIGGGGGSTGLVVYDINKPGVREMVESGKYEVVYSEADGKPLSDVWQIPFINPVSHERTGFNSQKPENLLKQIIEVFTDENDLVLDFFMGSGTTAVVSHKMNRKYISIEQIDSQMDIALERLKETIKGNQVGISNEISWTGGGEFIYFELLENSKYLINKILSTKNISEIKCLAKELLKYDGLNYKIKLAEFEKLSIENPLHLEDMKKLLIESIDKNKLYYNFSEIDDVNIKSQLTESDYLFNKSFYEKED